MRRNPLVLAGVLLVLVLVIFLLVRPERPEEAEETAALSLYPDLDTTSVDRIQIHTKQVDVDLFRDDGVWKVAGEESFPADPGGVERVLEAVANLTGEEVVSRVPEKYELFQVDSAGAVEVVVHAGGEEKARFYIGKSGPDFSSTYVRAARREEVFLQPDPLKGVFDRGTRTWKDKTILDFEEDQMAEIALVRGDTTVVFRNEWEEGWTVAEPEGYRPLAGLVQGMARGLTHLTAGDFGGDDEWERAGFEEPEREVRITLTDGTERAILIGDEREEGGGHYVKRGADEVLYIVPKSRVAHYLRPVDQLIEPIPPETTAAGDTASVSDTLTGGAEE